MRVSIVTPSYNQGQYIEDAIESVLSQSYGDVEYIVVDACSTDSTRGILDRRADDIDKVLIEKDDGQADAINKGFALATGEIFAYLNADDYYFSDTIERVVAYFEANPDVDMIYGDCVFTDASGQFVRYFSEISDFNEDRLRNYSDIIMQPAAFWRRRAFDLYGPFDRSLHYGFDWAFWCELARQGCVIKRVGGVLAANRIHSSTKTLSGGKKRTSELRFICNMYRTRLLPHAYYRYCLSDLTELKNKSLLDYFRLLWFGVLSYGNILHHFKSYKSKIINGVFPKSSDLDRVVRLRLPKLKYKSFRIAIACPVENQRVRVFVNQRSLGEFGFERGELVIESEIGGDDVDVVLEFDRMYKRYAGAVKRVQYFYQPECKAGELREFVLMP